MHLISQARVWTARGIPTYHAGVFGQAWYYLFHILMSRCFLKRHHRIHWVLLLLWQSGLTGHHACYSEEYICFWNSSISFLCSPSCLPSSPLVQAIVLLCINTCLLLPLVPVQSFQLNLSLIICISLYECCNDSNYLKSPQYGVSTCHLPHHQHHPVAHPLMQCHCLNLSPSSESGLVDCKVDHMRGAHCWPMSKNPVQCFKKTSTFFFLPLFYQVCQ